MVPGLGSVSGLASKEDFMSMLNRNFAWLLMMGIFPSSVPGCLRVQDGEETLFSFWVGGEEKAPRPMEFELCLTLMSALQTALISILYK